MALDFLYTVEYLKISFFHQIHLSDIDKSILEKKYYYVDELIDLFDFVAWFVVITTFFTNQTHPYIKYFFETRAMFYNVD